MNTFEKHELFEIEVLEKLKNNNFLLPLVFGGGTMLRLCHDLDRYSVDLDFWIIKKIDIDKYYQKVKTFLQKGYEVTDAQTKHFSLLFEIRAADYPRRLKIEIRREIKQWDMQERIAFSNLSNKQVLVRTHTMEQTIKNKIDAMLNRNEMRDAYDIEFLLRKGIGLPKLDKDKRFKLIKRINDFTGNDFKVKLGSIIKKEKRDYYITNGFAYLKEKLIES